MELVGKVTVLCVAVALLALADTAQELVSLFQELRERSSLGEAWFLPLYKTVAIAIVVRIGGDLCRDAGESALAGVVETAGAVCALGAAAPLMRMVLSLILELME